MNQYLKKTVQSIWFFRGRFSFLNFPLPVKLPFGSWYLAYGVGMGLMFFFKRPFEENEWRFARDFLKPNMTVLDVGANQGFYTLLAAKQVGVQGKVISFEPVESQLRKLKKNIAINHFNNVVAESLAVGAQDGVSDMYVCVDGDEALSSLRPPSKDIESKKEVIKVPVMTLDHYIQKNHITSVDFVKIDVEGGELRVLEGAPEMLKTMRPVLMCELQDIRTRQWGYESGEVCRFLEKHDYSCFNISKENIIAMPKEKAKHYTKFYEQKF